MPHLSKASKAPGKKNGSTTSDILHNASMALDVAKECAPLIPVPFIGSIFASAKVIVEAANNVKENADDCANLALRVATFVKELCQQLREHEELINDQLKIALEELKENLFEIKAFIDGLSSQNLFKRFVKRGSITNRLVEFTARLDFSLQTFKAMSSVRMEVKLELIHRETQAINIRSHKERIYDGQFRIYRLSDLYLLRNLGKEYKLMFVPRSQTIESYTAEYYGTEIAGRAAIVKFHKGSAESFRAILDVMKFVRHINIAQLDGYSEDEEVHFQVVKGDLHPLVDYMKKLEANERYMKYFQVVSSIWETFAYLQDHGLRWNGEVHKLMTDPRSGQVVIGSRDDIYLQIWGYPIILNSESLLSNAPPSEIISGADAFPIESTSDWSLITQNSSSLYKALQGELSNASLHDILKLWAQCQPYDRSSHSFKWSGISSPVIGSIGFVSLNEFVSLDSIYMDYVYSTETPVPQVHCDGKMLDDSDSPLKFTANSELDIIGTGPGGHLRAKVLTSGTWERLATHGLEIVKEYHLNLEHLSIVTAVHPELRAKYRRINTNSGIETETPIYFHIRPVEPTGQIRSPWAYFSTDPEPVPLNKEDKIPVKEENGIYESTVPGINAQIIIDAKVSYVRLYRGEARLLEWIYSLYKSTSGTSIS